jgi:hypothetical protein
MKPYGFIYITTNLTNGMKYIGQCSGDPESNTVKKYFGSGKAILRAIKKNSISNFSKEIIEYANTPEELNAAERRIIADHDAVKSRKYYNISPGGRASLGFTGKIHTPERNKIVSEKLMGHSVSDTVRKTTAVTGRKFANSVLNTIKVTCPHCGFIGNKGNLHRWHFDKCRFKLDRP